MTATTPQAIACGVASLRRCKRSGQYFLIATPESCAFVRSLRQLGLLLGGELLDLRDAPDKRREHDDNLFKVFPKERCIIGSGVLGTALPEPAHCVSTPAGGVQMNFGGAVRSELNDAACAEMLKCYRDGGCDAYWRDGEPGTDNNIYKFIWKKVCVNATVNTVCAVLRLKIGEVEADPFGQWLFHSVIRETCAVATAKGVPMDADEFIAHDHQDIVTNIADYYPSMCQDMLFNHRQTEIDVLNGKIAEYGEQLGIDTPVCKVLSQVVRCIQGNYDKQYLK